MVQSAPFHVTSKTPWPQRPGTPLVCVFHIFCKRAQNTAWCASAWYEGDQWRAESLDWIIYHASFLDHA
jgi:hypothetical protein